MFAQIVKLAKGGVSFALVARHIGKLVGCESFVVLRRAGKLAAACA